MAFSVLARTNRDEYTMREHCLFAWWGTLPMQAKGGQTAVFLVARATESDYRSSDLAITSITQAMLNSLVPPIREQKETMVDAAYIQLVTQSCKAANQALQDWNDNAGYSDFQTDAEIIVMLIVNDQAYIANVGGSTVYLLRAGQGLVQITDHPLWFHEQQDFHLPLHGYDSPRHSPHRLVGSPPNLMYLTFRQMYP